MSERWCVHAGGSLATPELSASRSSTCSCWRVSKMLILGGVRPAYVNRLLGWQRPRRCSRLAVFSSTSFCTCTSSSASSRSFSITGSTLAGMPWASACQLHRRGTCPSSASGKPIACTWLLCGGRRCRQKLIFGGRLRRPIGLTVVFYPRWRWPPSNASEHCWPAHMSVFRGSSSKALIPRRS